MRKTIILFILTLFSFLVFAGGENEMAVPEHNNKVTVIDYTGRDVTVSLPVSKIVTLNSGLSEITAALGAEDLIAGRCSYSTFPAILRKKPVVGKNSSSPNMETILELEPDLLIADAMFDENKIRILNNRGIAVMIESTSNPERLPQVVKNLGKILSREERAEEILTLIDETLARVQEKVQSAIDSGTEPTSVFFENRKPYNSASAESGHHSFIEWAGGINIAADEPVKYPKLSPEYITLRNPDVIIRRVSGDVREDALKNMIASIYSRPSLISVNALINKRIYAIKSDLFISLRYPIGVFYYASLFYPDQFPMADTVAAHKQYIEELYGVEEWERTREIYVYPR